MSEQEISIDIEDILGDITPEKIDIDQLETGRSQARQLKTKVEKDDKLVDAIRKTRGILHPIIVKDQDDGKFEIILGQRRWGAYKILVEEDPSRYSKIKAYVVKRNLSDDEKKIISFVENFGRSDMQKKDYIDVIEYFYVKYGRKITMAAKALGIAVSHAKKYLTEARLSDGVKECIQKKEFTIDTAIKALVALGDDEESVDDNKLIETARALKKLQPARRKKVIEKMKRQSSDNKNIRQAITDVPSNTFPVTIDVTDDQMDKIDKFKIKYRMDTKEEVVGEALEIGLDQGLEND